MNRVEVISYVDALSKDYRLDAWGSLDATESFELPFGVSNNHCSKLSMYNSAIIYGGSGSGKTTIVDNLILGCTMLYDKSTYDITVCDCKGILGGRYASNGVMLHDNITVKSKLEDIKSFIVEMIEYTTELRKSKSLYQREKLIIIDEAYVLLEDSEFLSNLINLLVMGHAQGVHCIITGSITGSLAYLNTFCDEVILLHCGKKDLSTLPSYIPRITLPLRYGLATYVEKVDDEVLVEISRIPKTKWTDMHDLLISCNNR